MKIFCLIIKSKIKSKKKLLIINKKKIKYKMLHKSLIKNKFKIKIFF